MTRIVEDVRAELDEAREELEAAQRALEDAEHEVQDCEVEVAKLERDLLKVAGETLLPGGRDVASYEPLLKVPADKFVPLDTLRMLAVIDDRFERKLRDVETARLVAA